MFFFLSKLLDVLLSPLSWSGLLLIAGAVVIARAPARRKTSLGLLAASLGVLYVFSLDGVANRLTRSLEDTRSTVREGVTYDAVVLMGGVVQLWANQPEGRRSFNDNVERLLATYDALRTGQAQNAIISGGNTDPTSVEAREAPTLAAQLVDWGIDPARIVIEATARNTHENAVEVKKIVDARAWKTVLVVTSAFHMERALECFRAVGLDVDSLVVDRRSFAPDGKSGSWMPRADALAVSTGAIHEWVGRWVYRAQGYAR